jgi:hypothetical protein
MAGIQQNYRRVLAVQQQQLEQQCNTPAGMISELTHQLCRVLFCRCFATSATLPHAKDGSSWAQCCWQQQVCTSACQATLQQSRRHRRLNKLSQ